MCCENVVANKVENTCKPLDLYLDPKGTIFWTCVVSLQKSIYHWHRCLALFVLEFLGRFVLVGGKSAVISNQMVRKAKKKKIPWTSFYLSFKYISRFTFVCINCNLSSRWISRWLILQRKKVQWLHNSNRV